MSPIVDAIMAIWLHGYMAIMAPNSHIAIESNGHYSVKDGHYGCFRNQQYKCSNLVKTVSQFDYPAANESKNGPVAYFPLYNFQIPFIKLKLMAKLEFLHLKYIFRFSEWSHVYTAPTGQHLIYSKICAKGNTLTCSPGSENACPRGWKFENTWCGL